VRRQATGAPCSTGWSDSCWRSTESTGMSTLLPRRGRHPRPPSRPFVAAASTACSPWGRRGRRPSARCSTATASPCCRSTAPRLRRTHAGPHQARRPDRRLRSRARRAGRGHRAGVVDHLPRQPSLPAAHGGAAAAQRRGRHCRRGEHLRQAQHLSNPGRGVARRHFSCAASDSPRPLTPRSTGSARPAPLPSGPARSSDSVSARP
jgi:hypothetical protein